MKELLILNWRQKVSARSRVEDAIAELLDTGLPESFTTELFDQKRVAVFQHVYESYPERDLSIYARAG